MIYVSLLLLSRACTNSCAVCAKEKDACVCKHRGIICSSLFPKSCILEANILYYCFSPGLSIGLIPVGGTGGSMGGGIGDMGGIGGGSSSGGQTGGYYDYGHICP